MRGYPPSIADTISVEILHQARLTSAVRAEDEYTLSEADAEVYWRARNVRNGKINGGQLIITCEMVSLLIERTTMATDSETRP